MFIIVFYVIVFCYRITFRVYLVYLELHLFESCSVFIELYLLESYISYSYKAILLYWNYVFYNVMNIHLL